MQVRRPRRATVLLASLVTACAARPPARAPLAGVRQLVLVRTAGYGPGPGWLRLYERAAEGAPWRPVGGEVVVRVGGRGLAWDRGLHGAAALRVPNRRGPDGSTPAGLYPLAEAFGALPAAPVCKLPYRSVEDPAALAAAPGGARPPASAGFLLVPLGSRPEAAPREPDALLRACPGLVARPKAARSDAALPPGIHVPLRVLRAILAWADPAAHPAVAVLPEREYTVLREVWRLPGSRAAAARGPDPRPLAAADEGRRYLVFLLRGKAWRAGHPVLEQPEWVAFVRWLRALEDAGRLAFAARPADELRGGPTAPLAGVLLLRARDVLEARRLLDAAPAIRRRVFRYELRTYTPF